ncbi:MAG TPA: aspartate aminotransferase family protein [Thermoanaerobaculia bacterium]|nr:aspartate aminotransferase family protein [Thermoanaerobaculia bacterium]
MTPKQLDRKYLARESPPEDLVVARAEGSYLWDAKGKKYIDFLAGWCVGNVGWGAERMRARIRKYRGPDYIYPYYVYKPWAELAQLLAELTPGNLQKCWRATGGTEAVDIALQVAMAYTGRRKFLSIEGSYHGNSIGTVSIASTEDRKPFPNLLQGCMTIDPPLDAKAADKVETKLKKRDVAAFIMEPISCNLGVLIPEEEFITRVVKSCRRYGTLFIADEVATGFGRTGKLFASEHFDLEPDLLCVSKAISGGYAPLGATITTRKIADAVAEDVGFYSTYGWHPLAVDAALANLRWIAAHRTRLLAEVEKTSDYFRERLTAMKLKPPGEVRIRGMAIGVETGDGEYTQVVADRCRRKGLLLTTADNTLTMFPALTIDRETAEAGLDVLERAL